MLRDRQGLGVPTHEQVRQPASQPACAPAAGAMHPATGATHPATATPTLLFFQLLMQGGIFQSCWSFTVIGRGGECITGTGGEPGPRGTCTGGGEEAPVGAAACDGWASCPRSAAPNPSCPLLPSASSCLLCVSLLPALPSAHPCPTPLALMCLNFGGCSGSTGMSCILMMRLAAPDPPAAAPPSAGVYCGRGVVGRGRVSRVLVDGASRLQVLI